jgi:hypothetical protein
VDETFRWILTNFQQVTVAGILAFALFALYRGWIVLGSTHKECRQEKAELESKVNHYIQEQDRETAELRQELSTLRRSRNRS